MQWHSPPPPPSPLPFAGHARDMLYATETEHEIILSTDFSAQYDHKAAWTNTCEHPPRCSALTPPRHQPPRTNHHHQPPPPPARPLCNGLGWRRVGGRHGEVRGEPPEWKPRALQNHPEAHRKGGLGRTVTYVPAWHLPWRHSATHAPHSPSAARPTPLSFLVRGEPPGWKPRALPHHPAAWSNWGDKWA